MGDKHNFIMHSYRNVERNFYNQMCKARGWRVRNVFYMILGAALLATYLSIVFISGYYLGAVS